MKNSSLIQSDPKTKASEQKPLVKWYEENHRPLPWRAKKNPYFIWVSEVMLQQTTSAAVAPYFENFIKKFPTLKKLSRSPLSQVVEAWAGLGYYSRARNLHKASKILFQKGFPETYIKLQELPGFGPYTSRAVSSIAFGESVGVLDGNVIRILCRKYGLKIHWWKTSERRKLQILSDDFCKKFCSSTMNQALMELGATVCTPRSPRCGLCPWARSCIAKKEESIDILPLSRPKKKQEIWIMKAYMSTKNKKIPLIKNNYAPFLKNQMIFPGEAKLSKSAPKKYDFTHSITHHKIFIQLKIKAHSDLKGTIKWVNHQNIKKYSPSSLVHKAVNLYCQ